ncbi:MAG: hypothetical protein AAF657_26490 [Acidobacteriota bacterium]
MGEDSSPDKKDEAPGRLTAATGAATERVRQAAQGLGDLKQRAWGALSGASSDLLGYLQDQSQSALESLVKSSKDLTVGLLPESRVRAFLLPTGSGRGDFHCAFDFAEVVRELAGGWLRRPCLEIWAARSDIDRRVLAASLRSEFTRQLEAERDRWRQTAEAKLLPKLATLERERSRTEGTMEWASFGLSSSLTLMFLVSNPIFNMVFLLLAVFSGAGGLTKALKYFQVTAKMKGRKQNLEREQAELESQLDGKNEEFVAAIKNLEVVVHPLLEKVLENFCEIDGVPYVAGLAEPPAEVPLVAGLLRSAGYRQRTPALYHPLIDVEIESTD